MVQILTTNTFTTAKWIVSALASDGTHTTIASALTSASSGDTIFIRTGTYTENLTLKAGVNLTAYGCDSSANATGHVIISGTCTLTAAGSVTISGIQLQTNSAAFLAVTGSAASIVNLFNCYLNCTNNTGITFSSSSASAQINIEYCRGDLGTTGISYFTDSSAGTLFIDYTDLANTGASVTASTKSAGLLTARFSSLRYVFTYSSSNTTSSYLACNATTNAINATALTTSGTGTFTVDGGRVDSGTASAISAGSGTTVACRNCIVFSSNTNAMTGAGSITSVGVLFSGSSNKSNVTTQTGGASSGLTQGTAPSAGFLGEQIRSFVGPNSVSLVSSTAKTMTSISLTAGVWDVYGVGCATFGTSGTELVASVNSVNNTLGTAGDNSVSLTHAFTNVDANCLVVPSYRVTVSTTTTYYLVVFATFAGTANGGGRISATRVG